MKTMFALLALSLASVQARAADEVSIETFESHNVGVATINIFNIAGMFNTELSGGEVAAAATLFPPHFVGHVYAGTSIELKTQDKFNDSWPGVGAWVSGADTIWLQAYEYRDTTGLEEPLPLVSIAGDGVPHYLSIGSDSEPRLITSAEFYSDSIFAIDELTLGIEGISPGIPEPDSWALMLFGFGSIGASMRYRRRAITVA